MYSEGASSHSNYFGTGPAALRPNYQMTPHAVSIVSPHNSFKQSGTRLPDSPHKENAIEVKRQTINTPGSQKSQRNRQIEIHTNVEYHDENGRVRSMQGKNK